MLLRTLDLLFRLLLNITTLRVALNGFTANGDACGFIRCYVLPMQCLYFWLASALWLRYSGDLCTESLLIQDGPSRDMYVDL